jgi:hypothetical protein
MRKETIPYKKRVTPPPPKKKTNKKDHCSIASILNLNQNRAKINLKNKVFLGK